MTMPLFVAVDYGFVNVEHITALKMLGSGHTEVATSDGEKHLASVSPTQFLNTMKGVLGRGDGD